LKSSLLNVLIRRGWKWMLLNLWVSLGNWSTETAFLLWEDRRKEMWTER